MNYLETVANILAKLPPDAVSGFGRMLAAILGGKPDKAATEARLTAETIAIKQAARAPFRARGK